MGRIRVECSACSHDHEPSRVQTVCQKCGKPLLVRYALSNLRSTHRRESFERGPASMWRFAALLPVEDHAFRTSLGEGLTPLLEVPQLGREVGVKDLRVKDEGVNPTGTFKARGLSMAVSRGRELGVRRFAVPTAGNAGVALAAYAARAGAEAHVFVPEDAPKRILENLARYGARVTTVRGLISDAGKACAAFVAQHPDVMDVSTLKEPCRVEGKKTMGLELAVDLGWTAPDVVVYPTGGGTGVIGIHKAFQELSDLGWSDGTRPRLTAVQAEGCAPIVKAMEEGHARAEFWEGARTDAAGLRVPKPFADELLLRALRESKGSAVAVSEEDWRRGVVELGRAGINASPESGAALAGCQRLVQRGEIRADETVVVLSTGSGLAY